MRRTLNATTEHLHVLTCGSSIYAGSMSSARGAGSSLRTPLIAEESVLQVMAGVIHREKAVAMLRAKLSGLDMSPTAMACGAAGVLVGLALARVRA